MSRATAGTRTTERALDINLALLATLTITISLTAYSVDAFLPGFPEAAIALGTSPSTMQLSISALLIGIAAGQLVLGPLSDRFGRRGPLVVGMGLSAVAAVAAAFAPSAALLIVARLIQGLTGSAASVLGKAIIRDRTSGPNTTRILATTMVGSGVLNIFAPVIGGQLASAFGWRGPLWFIAAMAILVFVTVLVVVPETHDLEKREIGVRWLGLPMVARHMRNRSFMLWVIIQAGSYGTLMAYVASSSFVYQNLLGFDAATYGILFSINAACAVACNFVANTLLHGVGAKRLVFVGLTASMTGTLLVLASFLLGAPPAVTAVCITLSMCPIGLNGPNLVGLALNEVTRATGSAAATIGFTQFLLGSIVSPVVGLWGDSTYLPMVITMFTLSSFSLAFLLLSVRRARALRRSTLPTG